MCCIPIPGDKDDNLLCNEAMAISSTVRVCFKTFSTKKNLNMCSDMLFDTNASYCNVLLVFCFQALYR